MKRNGTIHALIASAAFAAAVLVPAARAEETVTSFGAGAPKAEGQDHHKELSGPEMKALLAGLTDADATRRADAQWQLRLFGKPALTPELVKLLKDSRAYTRELSCELLAEIGEKSCLPAVCDVLLNDPDLRVRETAAQTLTTIGDRSVVAALVEAINQPRPLPDTIGYWLFPNDIYDNYRYAAANALNRITHNTFYLQRNETNFGRIAAQKEINDWWRDNKLFFTKDIGSLIELSREFTTAAKGLKSAVNPEVTGKSPGEEEFYIHADVFFDKAKNLHAMIGALPADKAKLAQELAEMNELATLIDETFVFSPELQSRKADWTKVKGLFDRLSSELNRPELGGKPAGTSKR